MEKLTQQQSCFTSIKTLCTNYSKDSPSRKTEEYLNKKLTTLEEQWQDFNSRHSALLAEFPEKNIKYFEDDIYSKTKHVYDSTKADMISKLRKIQTQRALEGINFDWSGMPEFKTDDNLMAKQEANFKAIERAMSKINVETTAEKWELEEQLSILKSKWEPIDKLHWILDSNLDQNAEEPYYARFNNIEANYEDMRKQLNNKIHSTVHYQQSAPRVDIPEFSGDYKQWISFKDLFTETIHRNPTITKAQKMQHLKCKLRGEAEKIVQHLSISAVNYDSCWKLLAQRYDNHHLQFVTFMNNLVNTPNVHQREAYNFKKMHDVINETMNGIRNIGIDTTTWDPIIVYLMTQKLDTITYEEYLKTVEDQRALPKLSGFLSYLEGAFLAYEAKKNSRKENTFKTNSTTSQTYKQIPTKKPNYDVKPVFSKIYHTTYGQCPLCNENHVLMQCPKFIDMNITHRNNTVSKLHLCKNCLYSHGNEECMSAKTCKECNMKHHTLLHYAKRLEKNNYVQSVPSTSKKQQSSNHLSSNNLEILLTTVQLNIQAVDGSYVTLRALLDQGSQVNLITEGAAQLLRLPRKNMNATISGIGTLSGDCKGRLQLNCKSLYSDYCFETQALVMKKITNNLPSATFEKDNWQHLQNLKLADPNFNISRPVDLLLGADVYSDIILDGVLKGDQQSPTAQHTQLGWILCGKMKTLNCHVTLIELSELTKFWDNENISQGHQDSPADEQCEEFYKNTVQRSVDGKYIVKMPLRLDYQEKLGNSKTIATSQFLQLEKRFEKQRILASLYKDFMKEYEDLGHMIPSQRSPSEKLCCFLPHHGVLRESSTTTKLRTVFNASQMTSTGYSLNSLLEKGPNLQRDLQGLILKWRTYEYAFTADIEKMYRCIWIDEEQQKLQKIIWRPERNENLQEYSLKTVTYGTKCAPWLAMRTLRQIAIDEGHRYPAAAQILQTEFYMDDLVSGHHSLQKASELQDDLINLLKQGGMNLRKWASNHPSLLENLSESQISIKNNFNFKDDESQKTLGLSWNPETDTFHFNWPLQETSKNLISKRKLLSEISKLYDPLRWLSPVTITAKLLFQKVWLSKLGWDDHLTHELQSEWEKLRSELHLIKFVKLTRWIGNSKQNMELMGFCDASEKAFACVLYSRTQNEDGQFNITLLAARTRVAPKAQKITLPRMELNGALLLSELIEKAQTTYAEYNLITRAWCDSQVVLAWIQGDSTRWETYIANRVTKIRRVLSADKWSYVKSELNPADCASRGLYPSKLMDFSLWWHGPEFLKELKTQESVKEPSCYITNLENKENKQNILTSTLNNNEHFIYKLLYNSSSLTRVIRIIAWIRRFSSNVHNNVKCDAAYLMTHELIAANEEIIKYVQRTEMMQDYEYLLKKQSVPIKSSIYKLQPYLDEKGIIRISGRLKNSMLPSEMKYPIILPKKSRLTLLLINQAHLATLHGGPRLTLTYIRQRYWIVGGNRMVKQQLRNCVRCHRYKTTRTEQRMGDLPVQRVTPSRPFTHTGVDFTGHVDVKLNKGRGVKTSKGYIAIFVCMATKAVHIELVSDLSTEAFLAAFQRMCARRGTPAHMYSDRGTNFIGAANVLRHEFVEFKKILSPSFFAEIGKLEVTWHFNAPAWPSAGGLWEAAVKSLKHHLRRVLGDQKLTYEEFYTLLTKIEACLNSRPLCALTEEPEEFYNCLTPGHFLTGGPTMTLPRIESNDVSMDLRRRWRLTEQMLRQFWKSWSNDYLIQLQARSKWNQYRKNVEVGDLVLVKEDNLPPGKWAMGRVQEVHPGRDGLVRVLTLKTQSGTLQRPIVKVSPLPKSTEPETSQQNLKNNSVDHCKKGMPGKLCLSTLLTTMLLLFTCVTGTTSITSNTQITHVESDRPIYYDTIGKLQVIHDEWKLIMYYNLTNYWNGVRRIETYIKDIENLCKKTDPRYCKTTLWQLQHEVEEMTYYNSILLAPHTHLSNKRKKRGFINGVGYIANSLFGILDQHFAERYQEDIQAIQNNGNYLLQLIKNQTSIVELQNLIMKKDEEHIQHQFNMIDQFMNQTNTNIMIVKEEIEIAMATSYFDSASLSAYMLIQNLKKIQEMLFNTLTNVYKGHIDVHLITPVNLIQQLTFISGQLPNTLSLPVSDAREGIRDLYKLLYVKARVTENFFIFEIHIPLISDEEYTLYSVIPLPIKKAQQTVITRTTSKYIAANFKKNTYISLNENDMRMCTKQKEDSYICHNNLPVYNLNNNKNPCEATLLSHQSSAPCDVTLTTCKEEWIELHGTNSWLAICCETCSLRTICSSEISSHLVTSSAIITISQGCILQSNDLTIYAHNQYTSEAKINYDITGPAALNSNINNMVNMTYPRVPYILSAESSDKQKLKQKIAYQKERESELPSTMTNHDLHQFVIGYLCLFLILLLAFFCVAKKVCCPYLCVKKITTSKPIREELELKPMTMITSSQQGGRSAQTKDDREMQAATEDNSRRDFIQGANNLSFEFE